MTSSAEEEQKSIDKVVEEYIAAIQVLRYKRNSLASISRLPLKILSRIFLLVKSSMLPFIGNRAGESLAWIAVTHVSTHWRSVAINSPILWDDPPPGCGLWVEEMLERSKTVDLSITTDFSSRVSHKVAKLTTILQRRGARIKHLTLTNMTSECGEVLQDLPVSAPQLKTLRLEGNWGVGHEIRHIRMPKTALNYAENLHQLILSEVNVHWHCLDLSNITYLLLHHISETARPTWTQFMDALAKMSKLEGLDLKSILDPNVEPTDDISSGPIHLPCLWRLRMESPTTEIEMFFRHITFPLSASVHVKAIPKSRSIFEVSAVISSIARLYAGEKFLTLALRDWEWYGIGFVRLQLLRKVFENPSYTSDNDVRTQSLSLNIVLRSTSGGELTVDEIVPEFFKNGLPMQNLARLQILRMWCTDWETCQRSLTSG